MGFNGDLMGFNGDPFAPRASSIMGRSSISRENSAPPPRCWMKPCLTRGTFGLGFIGIYRDLMGFNGDL